MGDALSMQFVWVCGRSARLVVIDRKKHFLRQEKEIIQCHRANAWSQRWTADSSDTFHTHFKNDDIIKPTTSSIYIFEIHTPLTLRLLFRTSVPHSVFYPFPRVCSPKRRSIEIDLKSGLLALQLSSAPENMKVSRGMLSGPAARRHKSRKSCANGDEHETRDKWMSIKCLAKI